MKMELEKREKKQLKQDMHGFRIQNRKVLELQEQITCFHKY